MNPQLDYLRCGTWDTNEYLYASADLMRNMKWRGGRWLQYKGKKSDDGRLFFGTGEQNRKRHHVIQISGGLAEDKEHEWRSWGKSFYCTRLDIQVTIEEPQEHDAETLYTALQRKGKSIVKSPGAATVYLGVRTSDLFTRIYEKPFEDMRYLRCEFELKAGYARAAWAALRDRTTTNAILFQQCLNQARVPEPHATWFAVDVDESGGLTAADKYKSLAGTKAWLNNTESGIVRHFGHEETRGMVLDFIERLEVLKHFAEDVDAGP